MSHTYLRNLGHHLMAALLHVEPFCRVNVGESRSLSSTASASFLNAVFELASSWPDSSAGLRMRAVLLCRLSCPFFCSWSCFFCSCPCTAASFYSSLLMRSPFSAAQWASDESCPLCWRVALWTHRREWLPLDHCILSRQHWKGMSRPLICIPSVPSEPGSATC